MISGVPGSSSSSRTYSSDKFAHNWHNAMPAGAVMCVLRCQTTAAPLCVKFAQLRPAGAHSTLLFLPAGFPSTWAIIPCSGLQVFMTSPQLCLPGLGSCYQCS